MKQIIQSLNSGETTLAEAPAPAASSGKILIQTRRTLISAGTERTLVGFGRASMIDKVRQQPEKVRMVLDKVRTDGVMTTMEAVRAKLNQPIPLGYCNVGVVVDAGNAVGGEHGFKRGDRVVSNGAHADVVRVPHNLCARIPDNVDDDAAAFTVLAAIGLQGVRLAQPTLGEAFVVTGVGVIGLLTVQLLRAHGCRVLAIDFDDDKLALAAQFGAATCNPSKGEDPVTAGMAFSRGQGVDGVILTAATASSAPVSEAARMSRKRGRIILVGVTGLELNRADFYEKELSFQVSCSYGPGRYDPSYEEGGQDYPLGFVRWTEQRNFVAVLDMLADGRLNVHSLISQRFAFDTAPDAYDVLANDKSVLGILLDYPEQAKATTFDRTISLSEQPRIYESAKPVVAFVGAGNYASRMLIPAFKAAGAQLKSIITSGGLSGVIHGRPAGFAEASTDVENALSDAATNTVVIVTRHDSHAGMVAKALRAGKHVFVEKPLALTLEQLEKVRDAWSAANAANTAGLMVGFNRRFAPQIVKMKQLLAPMREPKSFIITINAGAIPADHWTQDPAVGGGRIVGEACHMIDLMRFLAGSPIVDFQARRMGASDAVAITEDKASITLAFKDGSFGTIHYFANGASSFPKERVEVFVGGRILQLDNFRKLSGFGWPGFKSMNLWRQDKGHKACAAAFLASIEQGKPAPIPVEETFEVAKVTIEIAETLRGQV